MATSKEAEAAAKDFYTKLKSSCDLADKLSKKLKTVSDANDALVAALEKIEDQVGKGKPSADQIKAMDKAGADWKNATEGIADESGGVQYQSIEAGKAWNKAGKLLS